MDQKWFSLRPQDERDDYTDEDDWYSKATEAVYRALADSNFMRRPTRFTWTVA